MLYILSVVDAIALLADPTRRRIIELLTEADLTAGAIASNFEIARPGVSRHLRLLRESGLVSVTRSGQKRIYRLEPEQLLEIDRWLMPIRSFWNNRLDALGTELRRGPRAEMTETATESQTPPRSRSA